VPSESDYASARASASPSGAYAVPSQFQSLVVCFRTWCRNVFSCCI